MDNTAISPSLWSIQKVESMMPGLVVVMGTGSVTHYLLTRWKKHVTMAGVRSGPGVVGRVFVFVAPPPGLPAYSLPRPSSRALWDDERLDLAHSVQLLRSHRSGVSCSWVPLVRLPPSLREVADPVTIGSYLRTAASRAARNLGGTGRWGRGCTWGICHTA